MDTPAITIIHADALTALPVLPEASVDAVITDPPYGLAEHRPEVVSDVLSRWLSGERDFVPAGRGFMGLEWDRFVPPPALWDEVMRVLKPGGFLVSFAGSRSSDLMGISIRLAGFEIREPIAWIYSSSFPKGAKVGDTLRKAGSDQGDVWDGWNTTIKSTFEPIIMARKPLGGSLADNVLRYGTGALNADACRIPFRNEADLIEATAKNQHAEFGSEKGTNNVYGDWSGDGSRSNYDPSRGRLPANVVIDVETARRMDETNFDRKTGLGSSRFFLNVHEDHESFRYVGKATSKERPVVNGVRHNTVKPLSLMRWLVKLVTPVGGTVLDPHAGSGTTGEAALLEGFDSILVEREADFIPLIEHRVERNRP